MCAWEPVKFGVGSWGGTMSNACNGSDFLFAFDFSFFKCAKLGSGYNLIIKVIESILFFK